MPDRQLGHDRVLAYDLNFNRCGASFSERKAKGYSFQRGRLDVLKVSRLARICQVRNWVESGIEHYKPDLVVIEGPPDYGPTQSIMAGLDWTCIASAYSYDCSVLVVPPNDLKHFILGSAKDSKSDRFRKAMEAGLGSSVQFPDLLGASGARISHDEADAFFLNEAGRMVMDWLRSGRRDDSLPMNKRHILFSMEHAKHGLRGLAFNPGRYIYLKGGHVIPRTGYRIPVEDTDVL